MKPYLWEAPEPSISPEAARAYWHAIAQAASKWAEVLDEVHRSRPAYDDLPLWKKLRG